MELKWITDGTVVEQCEHSEDMAYNLPVTRNIIVKIHRNGITMRMLWHFHFRSVDIFRDFLLTVITFAIDFFSPTLLVIEMKVELYTILSFFDLCNVSLRKKKLFFNSVSMKLNLFPVFFLRGKNWKTFKPGKIYCQHHFLTTAIYTSIGRWCGVI